jgi:hypothetical protein
MREQSRVELPPEGAPPRRPPGRWVAAALLIGILGATLVGVWALAVPGPAAPPAPDPAGVRALYYQALDGAVRALDPATGVTRTLVRAPAVVSRLVAVSPGGQRVALLRSNRPLTATVWYAPLTETLYLDGVGAAARAVPLPDPGASPVEATFLDDDTLLVQTRPPRADQRPDLYRYDLATGTTRLLARELVRLFPFPELGVLLYTRQLDGPRSMSAGAPRTEGLWALAPAAPTPQPIATWVIDYPGAAVAAWAVPTQRAILYTRLLDYTLDTRSRPERVDRATFALEALPAAPLGPPTPVATFTTFSAFYSALAYPPHPGADAAYLRWYAPRPTPLPGTPAWVSSQEEAPGRWGIVRWTDGGPHLAPWPLPTPFAEHGSFVRGSTLLLARAGRWSPWDNPSPPTDTVRLYDLASGRQAEITVSSAVLPWQYVYPLGERLLVVDAPPGAINPRVPTLTLTLRLGEPTADSWRFHSLGALPPVPDPALDVYGLTADAVAVLVGLPQTAPVDLSPWRATLGNGNQVTALYRLPLDGGPPVLLAWAFPTGIFPRMDDGRWTTDDGR